MSDDVTLPPTLAALWRRDQEDRPRPGRRPSLSVEQIARAGIELADADGIGAVSMARVAERLGVTTMALYRYVEGKDQLLAVMADLAMPPPALLDDGPWRARLEAWCRAQLDAVRDRAWVVELLARPVMGPNRLQWIEHGLATLSGTSLPVPLRTAVIGMLSLHVLTEAQLLAAVADDVAGRPTDHPALADYGAMLRAVVDPATHPHVAESLAQGAFDMSAGPADYDAESNLALGMLLDGVEALVHRFDAAGPDAWPGAQTDEQRVGDR